MPDNQLTNKESPATITKDFYNQSYTKLGFGAQRMYPNEELCRFMGRNYFHIPSEKRKDIKILETGCGSGANLWMIAREGFDAYGIDLSEESLKLCKVMLDKYNTAANLTVQNMEELSFPNQFFDTVVDVFSSNCLTKAQGEKYLKRVSQIIKPGGLFFSYFPSKRSDAYQYPEDAHLVDLDTLNSILRKDSAFYGVFHPFRFMHPREYEGMLTEVGFEIQYSEIVGRTYNNRKENFELVVIEAKRT